jgi:hypothetical protein
LVLSGCVAGSEVCAAAMEAAQNAIDRKTRIPVTMMSPCLLRFLEALASPLQLFAGLMRHVP